MKEEQQSEQGGCGMGGLMTQIVFMGGCSCHGGDKNREHECMR